MTNAKEPPVTLSIVVIALTSPQQTLACLQQLRESNVLSSSPGATSEVIVVDLTGDETAPGEITAAFPCVTVVCDSPVVGFARACNLGLAAAQADNILLMDPFTEIPGRLVPDMVLHLDNNQRVAAVGPQLVDGRGLAISRAADVPPQLEASTELRTPDPPLMNVMKKEMTATHSVEWLPATCIMLSRRALDEIGGFQEGFLVQFEEIEWCKRAREGGWQVHHLQTVTVALLKGAGQQPGDGDTAGQLPYDEQFSESRRAYVRQQHGTAATLAVDAVRGARKLVRSAKAAIGLGNNQ